MKVPPMVLNMMAGSVSDTGAQRCHCRAILGYTGPFMLIIFWCLRYHPTSGLRYLWSLGSLLSRESQHISFNYWRNSHAVMRKPNAWWFNYGLNTHLLSMSTSGWYCCVNGTQNNVGFYSPGSICSQIGTLWWHIRCVSSPVFILNFFHQNNIPIGDIC